MSTVKKVYKIAHEVMVRAKGLYTTTASPVKDTRPLFEPPELPAGVIDPAERLAMDSQHSGAYGYANQGCGYQAFMGYPALAQLSQLAEYRLLSEKPAQAMVRKWVKIKSKSGEDKTILIKIIEDELARLNVRELFAEAAKLDGFFGRAQLFVDLGEHSGEELKTPMIMDKAKLKDQLRGFKIVEPMYTYPADYRSDNPLADSFYNPRMWYVMGQQVHASRLLLFVSRPLPDILKPAYNFGGMSMSQLCMPYVNNWLSTRDSVNRLIKNFSILGLKTNMQNTLLGDSGDDIVSRGELYNAIRDTQGLFMMDMEAEDLVQLNTPLTNLDKLQAQAQEHMSSVSSIPLVVLFGTTPAGLNASSEGEITVWYDYIADMQEVLFRENLHKVIEIIQLSKIGEVDPDILAEFEQLWEPDATDSAAIRKSDAETAAIYVDMQAISPQEVRDELGNRIDSGFNSLSPTAPEFEEEEDGEETGGAGQGGDPETDSAKPGQ